MYVCVLQSRVGLEILGPVVRVMVDDYMGL